MTSLPHHFIKRRDAIPSDKDNRMSAEPDVALDAQAIADDIRVLLSSQVQCVLATLSSEGPSQHLMAYAFDDDLCHLYVASLRTTEKIDNMLRRPAVSLLWDNRTGNTGDHIEGVALMATGTALVLSAAQDEKPARALLQRNDSLNGLLGNADRSIVAIGINGYRLVRGYTSVVHYEPATRAVTDQSATRQSVSD